MMRAIREYFQCLINPEMSPTALRVALVVGSLLLLINHGTAIIGDRMSHERWLSALLTYCVPYAVNIHGQYISLQKAGRRACLPGQPTHR
jgi:hypothetical protein